jgi:hypothetical protein
MRSFALWLLQAAILIWLLGWGLWALLLSFNEYMDASILDCDTDGDTIAWLSMWIIGLTTALVLGASIRIKFWYRVKALWFINMVAVIFSIASIIRYRELIQYNQQIQQYCK